MDGEVAAATPGLLCITYWRRKIQIKGTLHLATCKFVVTTVLFLSTWDTWIYFSSEGKSSEETIMRPGLGGPGGDTQGYYP